MVVLIAVPQTHLTLISEPQSSQNLNCNPPAGAARPSRREWVKIAQNGVLRNPGDLPLKISNADKTKEPQIR
jgi:hypothetical protein